jgi:hypothetical protein
MITVINCFFGIITIWSWEAIVGFVDIGGFVTLSSHKCINFNYKSTLLVSSPLLQCNSGVASPEGDNLVAFH